MNNILLISLVLVCQNYNLSSTFDLLPGASDQDQEDYFRTNDLPVVKTTRVAPIPRDFSQAMQPI